MAEQHTINVINGINMDVLQETIRAIQEKPELGKSKFRARNRWVGGNHNCTTIEDFYGAGREQRHKQPFELHADEPAILAGEDRGANPVEHLLNALAGCMTTGMVAHAAVRGIHIEELESELEGDIDLNGFLGLDNNVPKGYTNIRIKFKVKADVDNLERLKRLTEYSPVYNTLLHGVNVDVEVEPK
ncbi:MAG: OsmC family protein [Sedimentisphaerales bacterium]|nr:OsmC family protein [Sedimentisphaerales bacterium]